MDSPGYIILSRLALQSRATEVLAHNVANADTPGFRAMRPVFAEFVSRQTGTETPTGGRNVAFVQDRATKAPDARIRNRVAELAFEHGLLIMGCGANSMRIIPPLTVGEAEIAAATAAIASACAMLSQPKDQAA